MLTQSEIYQIADIIWERLLANQRPYLHPSGSKKGDTFIPEKDAAAMLGYLKSPVTFRRRVLGQGKYKNKGPLPIAYTAAGRGYRYSLEDIEKYLRRTSSR